MMNPSTNNSSASIILKQNCINIIFSALRDTDEVFEARYHGQEFEYQKVYSLLFDNYLKYFNGLILVSTPEDEGDFSLFFSVVRIEGECNTKAKKIIERLLSIPSIREKVIDPSFFATTIQPDLIEFVNDQCAIDVGENIIGRSTIMEVLLWIVLDQGSRGLDFLKTLVEQSKFKAALLTELSSTVSKDGLLFAIADTIKTMPGFDELENFYQSNFNVSFIDCLPIHLRSKTDILKSYLHSTSGSDSDSFVLSESSWDTYSTLSSSDSYSTLSVGTCPNKYDDTHDLAEGLRRLGVSDDMVALKTYSSHRVSLGALEYPHPRDNLTVLGYAESREWHRTVYKVLVALRSKLSWEDHMALKYVPDGFFERYLERLEIEADSELKSLFANIVTISGYLGMGRHEDIAVTSFRFKTTSVRYAEALEYVKGQIDIQGLSESVHPVGLRNRTDMGVLRAMLKMRRFAVVEELIGRNIVHINTGYTGEFGTCLQVAMHYKAPVSLCLLMVRSIANPEQRKEFLNRDNSPRYPSTMSMILDYIEDICNKNRYHSPEEIAVFLQIALTNIEVATLHAMMAQGQIPAMMERLWAHQKFDVALILQPIIKTLIKNNIPLPLPPKESLLVAMGNKHKESFLTLIQSYPGFVAMFTHWESEGGILLKAIAPHFWGHANQKISIGLCRGLLSTLSNCMSVPEVRSQVLKKNARHVSFFMLAVFAHSNPIILNYLLKNNLIDIFSLEGIDGIWMSDRFSEIFCSNGYLELAPQLARMPVYETILTLTNKDCQRVLREHMHSQGCSVALREAEKRILFRAIKFGNLKHLQNVVPSIEKEVLFEFDIETDKSILRIAAERADESPMFFEYIFSYIEINAAGWLENPELYFAHRSSRDGKTALDVAVEYSDRISSRDIQALHMLTRHKDHELYGSDFHPDLIDLILEAQISPAGSEHEMLVLEHLLFVTPDGRSILSLALQNERVDTCDFIIQIMNDCFNTEARQNYLDKALAQYKKYTGKQIEWLIRRGACWSGIDMLLMEYILKLLNGFQKDKSSVTYDIIKMGKHLPLDIVQSLLTINEHGDSLLTVSIDKNIHDLTVILFLMMDSKSGLFDRNAVRSYVDHGLERVENIAQFAPPLLDRGANCDVIAQKILMKAHSFSILAVDLLAVVNNISDENAMTIFLAEQEGSSLLDWVMDLEIDNSTQSAFIKRFTTSIEGLNKEARKELFCQRGYIARALELGLVEGAEMMMRCGGVESLSYEPMVIRNIIENAPPSTIEKVSRLLISLISGSYTYEERHSLAKHVYEDGHTALTLSQDRGWDVFAKELMFNGACLLHISPKTQMSPLIWACYHQDIPLVEKICERLEQLSFLERQEYISRKSTYTTKGVRLGKPLSAIDVCKKYEMHSVLRKLEALNLIQSSSVLGFRPRPESESDLSENSAPSAKRRRY